MISDHTADDFFTPRHARLTNLAAAANIFAWIVLVLWTLYVGLRLYGEYEVYHSMGMTSSNVDLVFSPVNLATEIVAYCKLFLQGVIYWLVLKGVSLGLNMIVETDLTYREKSQEAHHE